MKHIDAQELADRYIAVWAERESGRRRAAVEELWTRDGTHVVRPPVDAREAAAARGFDAIVWRAVGHEAIERRIARSHEAYVAPGEYMFRVRRDAVLLDNIVKFTWEMAPAVGGGAVGGGVEVLILDEDGRIGADYMFPGL